MCVVRVGRALSSAEGVEEASVNFAAEKANVSYDPSKIGPNGLIARIEDDGYAVVLDKTGSLTRGQPSLTEVVVANGVPDAELLSCGCKEKPWTPGRSSRQEISRVDGSERREKGMTEVTLRVEGMSCAHCKAPVEDELGKVSGVERSNADVERGVVEVAYDESKASEERLREAVEEAGYAVA